MEAGRENLSICTTIPRMQFQCSTAGNLATRQMGEEKQFHPQIVVLEWRKFSQLIIMLAELAAAEIAKIAFEAVIGKLTEGAMDKGVELWQKIKQKLQKEPTAAQVLAAAEETKSEAIIEQQVVPFLQVEMLKDTNFAQEIQTLAQQIMTINQNQTETKTQIGTQINKDIKQQLNIQEVKGDLNLGIPPE